MKSSYSSPLRKFPLSAMAVMASVVGFSASANAAAVAVGETFRTGSSKFANRTLISVTSGSEGFSANDADLSQSFNGAIADYGFLTDSNTTGTIDVTGGGSLLSFSADSWATFGADYTHLWTSTTPDGTFSNADVVDIQTKGNNLTTTVDISGFSSGSVYLFYGANSTSAILDVTLSGAGQTDIFYDNLVTNNNSTADAHFMARFDFTEAASYDTLSITYNVGNGKTGATRFSGAVVTNVTVVPEPSAALLGGLGTLLLLRRRRN